MMNATMKKRGSFKPIPPDRRGEVTSNELAKLLGVTYQSIFQWTKSGRITPIPSEIRNKKYDLDTVRAQLSGLPAAPWPKAQLSSPTEPPSPKAQPGSGEPKRSNPPRKSVPEIAGERPSGDPFETERDRALKAALKVYRKKLLRIADQAEAEGDFRLQAQVLKHCMGARLEAQ